MSFIHLVSILLLLLQKYATSALEVIHVPAADMTKQDGSDVVFSTERFESYAFIRTGDEIKFSVTTTKSGTYTLHASMSNPSDLGAFAVTNSDTSQIYGAALRLPVSESWDVWNTITVDNIKLSKGTHPLELTVVEGGWKIQYLYLVLTEEVDVVGPNHYMVPGVDLIGFLGVEYYSYEKIVAQIDRGDWFAYNLPVKTAGNYTLHFWVASPEGNGSFRVLNAATKKPYASIRTLPITGDWLEWAIVDVPNIRLEAGNVPINISVTSDGWNFCMLSYELYDSKADAAKSATDCGANLAKTELVIGESTTFAAETICDNEGISFETSSEGGLNIGWLDEGNWVAYDLNLATAGVYDLSVRYSSVDGDGGFYISNMVTGDIYQVQQQLEMTGDWQVWSTLQNSTVSLPSGTTTFKLTSLGGGWNLQWMQLTRRPAGTPVSLPGVLPVVSPAQAPGQLPDATVPGQQPLIPQLPGQTTATLPVGAAPGQLPLVTTPSGLPVLDPVPPQVPAIPLGQAPLPVVVTPVIPPVQAPLLPLPPRPLGPVPVVISQTATAPVRSPVLAPTLILPIGAAVPLQTQARPLGQPPVPLQSAPVLARSPFISPTLLV